MPFRMRPLLTPVYLVTEQMEKLLATTLPKLMLALAVPWSASTGTGVPCPLMLVVDSPGAVLVLAADGPDGDSVATRLFPEA